MKKHTVFKTITIILVIITTVFFASVMTVFADETATEDNVPAVTKVDSGNWGMYASASMWLSLGASFSNADESDEVKFFITDKKDGKEEDCVNGYILTTTVADTPDVGNSLRISKTTGFQVESLAPGTYYIGCKLVSGESVTYQYRPFIVFPTAKEYVKAALDLMITEAYMKDNTGYFYDEQGVYQGLGGNTYSDTGVDWECWIFSSLGNSYTTEDGQVIDMSINGDFLSSAAGKTYLDYLEERLSSSESNEEEYSNKDLFRYIAALCACGADPRNFNGRNLVQMLITRCYYADGTPRINSKGRLSAYGIVDAMSLSYLALALEMSGASPEEGYTEAIRQAALNSVLYYTTPIYDSDGNAKTGTDGFAMTMLPLQFMKDIDETAINNRFEEYVSIMQQFYLSSNAAVSYTTGTEADTDTYKGTNMNTAAVIMNALVSAGITAKQLEEQEWQKQYGAFLTTFLSGITDSGEAIYGLTENRMASYQTLGALVDLHNDRNCFLVIEEKYKKKYPEYFEWKNTEDSNPDQPEDPDEDSEKDSEEEKKRKIKTIAIRKAKTAKTTLKVKAMKKRNAKITWKKVVLSYSVDGKNYTKPVTGYKLYRSTKKKSGYKCIKTLKGASKIRLINRKLKKGRKYYYKIKPYTKIDGKVYYGKWSKIKRVKTK